MRPAGAFIQARLPVSRVPYQWDLESVRRKGHRDAAQGGLLALVDWSLQTEFTAEAVGYTTYTPGAITLTRVLPLRHPIDLDLWCDDYDLESYGAYETRSDFGGGFSGTTPAQDWSRYALTFIRPLYPVIADEILTGVPGYNSKEQFRYTTLSILPKPRERVVSGMGYAYLKPGGDPTKDADWTIIPDERQFIPDYQIDLVVTWIQIPVSGVPFTAIYEVLNTANSQPIQFEVGGRTWNPGELLFKGLGAPITRYVAANGSLVFDLAYMFTFQPGGWNKYLTRDGAGNRRYMPVRIRGGAGAGFPPYTSTDFQKLFIPSNV